MSQRQAPHGERIGPGGGRTAFGTAGRDIALLLLGHGSRLGPATARPVRALASDLRRRGPFSEVRVGFWKEPPHLDRSLWTVRARKVVVVPIFTSTGYFTEHVVPRELALGDPSRRPPGMRVHLCPAVGTHPGMVELILDRARSLGQPGFALVLVGHGTPRHSGSGRMTRALARSLADRWAHGPVAPAFLDEAPSVAEVIAAQEGGGVVVVPFFVSEGWHAGVTLPDSLAVERGTGRLGEKEIRYTQPVGTHPRLWELVVDLATRGAACLTSAHGERP